MQEAFFRRVWPEWLRWAAGKKRRFCRRSGVKGIFSQSLAGVAALGGRQKAWFLPAQWR
jgi:hypothetical protein